MAFWSGTTLRARLDELIDKPDPDNVDCAAYTLKVGPEYYVTPSDRVSDPKALATQPLAEGASFAIPPGQFGYVLTEETITVPPEALAFISIRARIKWKGLVNVSGFHVDPGFHGRLLFAVYNAGPVPILLRRGDPTFLIWFADLDTASKADSKAGMKPIKQIDLNALNQVAGEIYSVQGLSDKIRTTETELAKRITALERANGIVSVVAGAALTVLLFLAGQWLLRNVLPPASQPPPTAQTGAVSTDPAGTSVPQVAPKNAPSNSSVPKVSPRD